MIVLSAYYKGTVAPESRDAFDDYVLNVHLPLVATWPRLKGLRLLKNDQQPYLGEAPQYYQCFQLFYDSYEDLELSLASEEREETKRITIADRPRFKDLFQGEILHMVYEASSFPCKDAVPA